MAIQLVSLKKVKQPLKNTVGPRNIFDDQMRYLSENLYKKIKESPELVSLLDTIVSDHFMGPIDFFAPNGKSLGSTKLKQVETFWQDQNVQGEAFYGQGLDLFVDGSSFGWHVSANDILTAKQKEAIAKIKGFDMGIASEVDESMKMPRKVSYIAASTTSIKYDKFGVNYYVQDASGERVRWEDNQIVHVKLMDFNGEIRGFSALKALTKEIVMMFMLKENIMAALSNGGSMDNIISLVNANGTSKARFERLRSALESFSHLHKSHGNMPIDGDIKVHPLGAQLKDMEYRELAMFVISEYALALGIPTSRVPFLMTGSGGSSNKGELSGNSEDSYQTKINSRRSSWENAWNKVFRKAGFTFKFRRDNLQDDVRETQAAVQRSAYVAGIQSSLFKAKKQLKLNAHLALLSGNKMNIAEDDVENLPEDMLFPQDPAASIGGPGGKMQPNSSQLGSKVTQDKSIAKDKTSFNNERFK